MFLAIPREGRGKRVTLRQRNLPRRGKRPSSADARERKEQGGIDRGTEAEDRSQELRLPFVSSTVRCFKKEGAGRKMRESRQQVTSSSRERVARDAVVADPSGEGRDRAPKERS